MTTPITPAERDCRHQLQLAELRWRRQRWEARHKKPAPYPPAQKLVAAALIALRELDALRLPTVT